MDQPKQGLFSSLSLGRASRSPKPPSEGLTHPLLAASTSSLNLPSTDQGPFTATSAPPTSPVQTNHKSVGSWSQSGPADNANLPYKPRQKHGGGTGSAGSANAIFGPSTSVSSPKIHHTSSTSSIPTTGPSSSPATPTTAMPAAPTTATSTSTTFALPPSASEPSAAQLSDPSAASAALSAGSGSLTSRLQMQSLKAAAQRIGLGNGSMGMSIIDAIFEKGQLGRTKTGEGGDWGDLLRVLMSGKAILLLPTTPSSSLPMTPQTLRDHIAFLSPAIPAASSSYTSKLPGNGVTESSDKGGVMDNVYVLLTLSGLIGTLQGSAITFESTLPSDAPLLAAVRESVTRQTVLSTLRPTQLMSSSSPSPYPSFSISSDTAILHFPPPSKNGATPSFETKEKTPQGKAGRINPFASLFGGSKYASPSLESSPKNAHSSAPASPPQTAQDALSTELAASPSSKDSHNGLQSSPRPSSPRPSLLSMDLADVASINSDAASLSTAGEGFTVTAYTISKAIRLGDTHKSLTKAVRTHVRDVLNRLPDRVIDKVLKLVQANVCPLTGAGATDELLKGHKGLGSSDHDKIATLHFDDPAETGERLQDFIEGIYDDLVAYYRAEGPGGSGLRRKGSVQGPWSRAEKAAEANEDEAKEKREKARLEQEDTVEREASEGTERVEGLICRLLYNRLFSPLESDDAKHDEALASRIAALNMLDLSLDHLGLITHPENEKTPGGIAKGLVEIVDRIGDELQKLSGTSFLTPREKANVLIKAHKIVVDGLSGMPAVELRPEGETYRPPPSESPDAHQATPDSVPLVPTRSRSSVSSSSSHPLADIAEQTSPSASTVSDSATAVGASETTEATPMAFGTPEISPTTVPELVLTESAGTDLKEAMTDSVMTVTQPLSRDPSSSSHDSTSSSKMVKSSTSGADLILPIIIYAVVKSNPPQLASQLMYLRRYRSAICLTGEASYAIVNLTAVVEFLEHVDLAELGLGQESDKVISVHDLSPIGLDYLDDSNADAASIASASSRLRGRVFQVGELAGGLAGTAAGSANKVISGVMDSSWSALRGLISVPANLAGATSPEADSEAAPAGAGETETVGRPGMRPRQASSFSLASVTASVASIAAAAAARNRSRASSRASEQVQQWGGNQELQEVASRPASIMERDGDGYPSESDESEMNSDDERLTEGGHNRRRSAKTGNGAAGQRGSSDTPKAERASLSNRLASIGVLGRLSTPAPSNAGGGAGASAVVDGGRMEAAAPGTAAGYEIPPTTTGPSEIAAPAPNKPAGFLANLTRSTPLSHGSGSGSHTRRSSLVGGNRPEDMFSSPRGSIVSLPPGPGTLTLGELDLPSERFMTCELGDIKLSEIGELLREYRRLGSIINNIKQQQG